MKTLYNLSETGTTEYWKLGKWGLVKLWVLYLLVVICLLKYIIV